jgi:hypothetical protein
MAYGCVFRLSEVKRTLPVQSPNRSWTIMAFNPSRSGSAYHTTPSHKFQNKHIHCPGLVVVEALEVKVLCRSSPPPGLDFGFAF